MKQLLASAGLILATLLWGSAFAAQRNAMTSITPVAFIILRNLAGVAALALVIMLLDVVRLKKISLWGSVSTPEERRTLLAGGFFCGLAIAPAMISQQTGLLETSAGKSGFLTALYIIIVPVLGIFFKRRTSPALWLGVGLALTGSFLLCYQPGAMTVSRSDLMVILCAFCYALHILVSDRYAPHTDCIRLSFLQFVTATVLAGLVTIFVPQNWSMQAIQSSMKYWIYCGIGSTAIAFTLQMASQKYLPPVTTSLLMSLESVFAVLAGWLFLQEKLTLPEFAGCLLVFLAVLIAQLPERRKTAAAKKE
ncbi:MAG: DMT family transporter [Lentisphaeria bacterium]|nr:DMT family transporter [Lentisphaeria bacterium]